MPLERMLFVATRVPEAVVFGVVSLMLAVAVGVLIPDALLLVVLYGLMVLYVGVVATFPRLVALILARRDLLVFGCIGAIFLLAAGLAIWIPQALSNASISEHATFLLLGTVLGTLLRRSLGRIVQAAALGRRRLGRNVSVIAVWSVLLALSPIHPDHSAALPAFVAGVALGVLLHKGSRWWFQGKVEAYQMIKRVIDAWPRGSDITEQEGKALALLEAYAFRYRRLLSFFRRIDRKGELTKPLALLRAVQFRKAGMYGESNSTVIRFAKTDDVVDIEMRLIRALNLWEEERDSEAEHELDEVLRQAPHCALANATRALRRAEDVIDGIYVGHGPSKEPLELASKAVDLHNGVRRRRYEEERGQRQSMSSHLTRLVDLGVPITPLFIVDLMGLCELAAGFPDQARIHLEHCIRVNPSYSAAYLHLGDFFMLRRPILSGEPQSAGDLWHGALCFHAAYYLEVGRESRTRRVADRRRAEVRIMLRQREDKRAA